MSVRFNETEKERLANKELYEKRRDLIENYNQRDNQEYPAWTFLLKEVKTEYGTCPFLNLLDPDTVVNRKSWLESRQDGGDLYRKTIGRFANPEVLPVQEMAIMELKKSITDYVSEFVKDVNELVENTRVLKNTASRTKKTKVMWEELKAVFDKIYFGTGISLELYIKNVRGIVIAEVVRAGKADPHFNDLINRLISLETLYKNDHSLIMMRKLEAEADLVDLIERKFQIEQLGKYFKRWGLLTEVQKEERFLSYAEYITRQKGLVPSFAQTAYDYIIENIQAKKIRPSDIKWVLKSGIVEEIIGLTIEDDQLSLAARVIVAKVTKTSKKKPSDLSEKDYKRLNRLLLMELMQNCTPQKSSIMKNVMTNFHPRLSDVSTITTYLSVTYEKFTNDIMNYAIN